MTGPAADAERETLGGGDAVSRLVQASDGVELHCLRWYGGPSPPWAVVVFLHGIASHGGWFAETAADLDTEGVLLQGEDDAMMDVAGTRHWFSRLGVEDKTYRAYPGAGHTLDFEPDRSRYLADMLGWLSDRVPSRMPRSRGGGP
jgi:alpha-beta hydrolase superfamily lysophospholipase